jgi:hypothetical protein
MALLREVSIKGIAGAPPRKINRHKKAKLPFVKREC